VREASYYWHKTDRIIGFQGRLKKGYFVWGVGGGGVAVMISSDFGYFWVSWVLLICIFQRCQKVFFFFGLG
jgi:hypothetical protein